MRRLIRFIVRFLIVSALLAAAGHLAARMIEGDAEESDDEFDLAAFWGGRQWRSTAAALRRGSVRVILGGVDLDFTDATVDPDGASLDLDVKFGGVKVTVPPDWRVEVEQDVRGGEVEMDLADPDTLAEDAPQLTLSVTVRAGGVMVSAS